jgi:hypothetical protein
MSSKTERRALALVLLLGVSGCPEPEPLLLPPPPPSVIRSMDADAGAGAGPERIETLSAVVFEFDGKAQVLRKGTGEWVDLAFGDAVRVDDQVRTSADGHLEMRFGDARIQVQEGSELALKFLDARAIRADVKGVVSGNATDGGELTFEGRGTGVVAVSNGQLSLDANDQRAVVSSLSGGARLTSDGSTVQLAAGESVTARQGAGLARPSAGGKKVLLKMAWPHQAETNQQVLVVKGKASANARVLVMGRRVEPGADGSFEAKVELKRGPQVISILAIDPLGRKTTEKRKIKKRKITYDPNAPSVRGKVEYK